MVVFPTEYRELQREYPIFFRKEPGGDNYLSVAMLGFAKDENLFLEDAGWNARYLPAVIARGPFLIGFEEAQIEGELRKSPVIHIDLDHPQVSETEGEPLVSQARGQRALSSGGDLRARPGFIAGLALSKEMFAAFTALDLIDPFKLEVKLTADAAARTARVLHGQSTRSCAHSTRHRSRDCIAMVFSRAPTS